MQIPYQKQTIPQLDGFRAMAIILVVIYHMGLNTSFYPISLIKEGGWGAVQLFFVLSGFLLSLNYIHQGRYQFSSPSTFEFYKKRVLRIFPLYFFSLLFYIAYGYFRKTLPPVEDIALHFVFMHNILPENSAICSPYWSLAIEAQVYLLFPMLAYLLYRSLFRGRRTYLLLLTFLIAVPPVYRIFITVFYPGFDIEADYIRLIYSSTFSNLDSFGWGMAGAMLYAYKVPEKLPIWAGWLGLLLSVLMIGWLLDVAYVQLGWRLTGGFFAPGLYYSFLNMGWAMMILSSLVLKKQKINRLFTNRFFHFIALISYSMYIWHMILIGVIRYLIAWMGVEDLIAVDLLKFSLSSLLILLVSAGSYYVVEQPFLQRKKSFLVKLLAGTKQGMPG